MDLNTGCTLANNYHNSMQYLHYFDTSCASEASKSTRVLDRARPSARTAYGIRSTALSDGGHSAGKQRLHDIREVLENGFTWKRSKTQKRFHESFLNACVRFLFAEDGSAPDYRDIMDDTGWDDIRQQCLCMTPRRFWQTVAVGMFVSALALVVPSEQAIFSTGRRASSKLLELVSTLISQVAGGQDRIIKVSRSMGSSHLYRPLTHCNASATRRWCGFLIRAGASPRYPATRPVRELSVASAGTSYIWSVTNLRQIRFR